MLYINTFDCNNNISEIYYNKYYNTYSNKVYTHGNNKFGELGIGISSTQYKIPNMQEVLLDKQIKDIKIAKNLTYFIMLDNTLYACGDNTNGILGIGSNEICIYTPQKVLIEEIIKDILIYKYYCYFITNNNKVYASGDNVYGTLGIGSHEEAIRIPQKVLIEKKIKKIKTICNRSYYITYDDELFATGVNVSGELGIDSDEKFIYKPQKVLIKEKIKDIILYDDIMYILTIEDEIYACGYNENGQLGTGSDDESIRVPQKVLIEEKIKNIIVDDHVTFLITITDNIYAFGYNKYGQLGINSIENNVSVPQKVLIEDKIKDIKIYYRYTYFITLDNIIYACGDNDAGHLGIGSHNKVVCIPQKVLIEEKIKHIEDNYMETYFITTDNEVYACGYNEYGQLGINSTEKYIFIPQKVLIEEQIKKVIVNENSQTCFITFKHNGYACGNNNCGQFGIGIFKGKIYTPQKILIKEEIKQIEVNSFNAYFITCNNEIYICDDKTCIPHIDINR